MSKAYLIMDMPNSCDECNFIDECYHYCDIPWFGKDVSDYVACRHEDCPLRELPQKYDEKDSGYDEWQEGYNACIDEILKGSE